MADKFTNLDETHATLIGVLMVAAKFLQMSLKDALLHEADPTLPHTGAHHHFLVMSLSQLARGDGEQLEKDTLALAKVLGFNVQQEFLKKQTETVQ